MKKIEVVAAIISYDDKILCVEGFVLTIKQGVFGGENLEVEKKEKGSGSLSPYEASARLQFTLPEAMRGGVHVFNLEVICPLLTIL